MKVKRVFLKGLFFIPLLGLSMSIFAQVSEAVTGSFMGMAPTDAPKLLAPELIASSLDEYNGTFNPNGDEFFYTTNTPRSGIISVTRLQENNEWSEPMVASFSGAYSEYDPLFSPDGKRLYFSSERPIPGDSTSKGTHIWYVERQAEEWSEPEYVDLNQSGNYYSSITNDGSIYFNVWDNGDLFKASQRADSFYIERLSDSLNSDNGEGDPFISPDEDYIIFRAYNNSLGRGDHYISFNINGVWTKAENLGSPINSKYHEMCPYVTTDGRFFIFASSRMQDKYPAAESLRAVKEKHKSHDNGQLNIYYISADFIDVMRKKHMK